MFESSYQVYGNGATASSIAERHVKEGPSVAGGPVESAQGQSCGADGRLQASQSQDKTPTAHDRCDVLLVDENPDEIVVLRCRCL